jgi:preprotein translocase subunit SecY
MRKMVFELQEMSLLTALALGVGGGGGRVGGVGGNGPTKNSGSVRAAHGGPENVWGASTFLPLKVDQSGRDRGDFCGVVLSVPVTFASFNPDGEWSKKILGVWNQRALWYEAAYAGLIIFFCYFYNSVQFNPMDWRKI